MSRRSQGGRIVRAVAVVLVPTQVLLAVPVRAAEQKAIPASAAKNTAAPPTPPKVKVNRKLPVVRPVPAYPSFSAQPGPLEIFRARVFDEPLVPVGGSGTGEENQALAEAILSYLHGGDSEDLASFEGFLRAHPQSVWCASLLTNLGVVYRRAGYFSKALVAWEEAWERAKGESDTYGVAVADRAIGELLDLSVQFGRVEAAQGLVSEIEGRDVRGSAAEKVALAQEGLWLLLNKHEDAIPSGPAALDRILAYGRPEYRGHPRIEAFHASHEGASLFQIQALSGQVGLKLQMAFREADAELVAPSVLHWKLGHFSAVVKVDRERKQYLVHDPILSREMWLSREVVKEESTGYFLVPAGALPLGWRRVEAKEGEAIRGKCGPKMPPGPTKNNNPGGPPQVGGGAGGGSGPGGNSCNGMATYSFHELMVSLHIADIPVGYTPLRGPAVQFRLSYSQREGNQPQIFYYSNFGPKWTFDFISYLEDNPTKPFDPVQLYMRGGGKEIYTDFDGQAYGIHYDSRAIVVRTSISPIRYERRLPDGSIEVFGQADGAMTSPRRVFMTESIDPQGNRLQFAYDESLRLVAITDALGQVTTLEHGLSTDPLKITKVTDPFGRSASFEYDDWGRLVKITDVIGIASQFDYGQGDFISALTTPYGTTSFRRNENFAFWRWLEATDPLGGRERLEYRYHTAEVPSTDPPEVVPVGFLEFNLQLDYASSFFWGKRAMALHPGDYTKAHWTRWLYSPAGGAFEKEKHSEKKPLEHRVWYSYVGNTYATNIGTETRPTKIARVLDDGASQIHRYEYGPRGNVTRETDPLGRETVFEYDTNEIDLLRIKQKNGAAYDLLQTYTYNSQHQPLTMTDAAGQTTTYTYTPTGEIETVATPPRGGLTAAERTTTYEYYPVSDPVSPGRLKKVTGPSVAAGSPTTTYTYDSHGRTRTLTDPDGYTVTYDYDALDRPTRTTYPDGTYEETVYNRLDPERRRDRLGRWRHTFYDALRRQVALRDPLGRTTTFERDSASSGCGGGSCGSVDKLIDANGNATISERDLQGRVTREVRADGNAWEYTYENTTSRPKQRKDPKNQITGYEYFLDNNLKQVTYTNAQVATSNISFTYDPSYNRVATTADGIGTTTYSYNPVGTPASVGAGQVATIDGPLANDAVSYTYDELGRIATRGLSGASSTYSRDALGRVSLQATSLGSFTYTYDAVTSRLATIGYPNGQLTQSTYFPNSGDRRLQEIKHLAPGGATLSKYNYTYDTESNVKTWTQQMGASAAKMYELGYDPADQLRTATLKTTDATPVVLKRYGYDYDVAGNRTTEQVDDSVFSGTHNNRNQLSSKQAGGALLFRGTVNEPATVTVGGKPAQVAPDNRFEGAAQVSSGTNTVEVKATDPSGNLRTNTYQVGVSGVTTSYSYDANGNFTGDGTRTFEWDAENRLAAVKQGVTTIASFAYDGLGRRVQRVAGGVTHTFVYDGDDLLEERLSTGGTIKYVEGPGIDNWLGGQDTSGAAFYYGTDHLGSIVQVTNSAGQVTLTREYDPWGNLLQGASQSGPAFTGREWDSDVQLYYYRARYYNPKLGRFLSEDSLDRLAHYEYVGNQPIRATDPSGHFKFYPDVQVQGAWLDGGATYLENPRVTPQCRPCGSGWSLEFTVNVRILSQYSLFCPWFSKPHEALHVALFLQKAVFFANLYLKPREHAYPTYGECLRAGNEGKRLYEGIPKKEWDKGHEAIDKYITCIWQL